MRLGPLVAEVTNPESEKFTASLLLVHGLWERATTWRPFAGYLAHRGWRGIAVARRAETLDIAAHVADLRAAVAQLEAPPIIIGHDFGALVALACCDVARAVVALAPLVTLPLAAAPVALHSAGNWLARRRGTPLTAPRGRWRAAYPSRDLAEPAALVRQILADGVALSAPTAALPRAVFAAELDEVTPATAAAALAQHVGAELRIVGGVGHAVLTAPGWETPVAAVHRWVIQQLGVDLLAFYEEAMQEE